MTEPVPVGSGMLSTDMYQLTMAQLYFTQGLHERTVRFEHFYRHNPDYGEHQAGYCIAAGLGPLVEWIAGARATDADLRALRQHRGRSGERLFSDAFCEWFAEQGFDGLQVSAVPEGRVVHPNTPITVVEGPLAQAQLLETPLLNHLNFPTLIATKASRVVEAAHGRPVVEFGLRRAPAQGGDAASRAALVGGVLSTSNAAEGFRLGVPPTGTHAHSMVQLYLALGLGEQAAFEAYADVYPDDCLLLVDTVDTLGSGVPNAIRVFERLRRDGHQPVGIRLDSGDLAHLAVHAARMLDDAGFGETAIVLSNQLDEITMWQILSQIRDECQRAGVDADRVVGRLLFGAGSRLVTSHGDPSLDGVYKLVAVADDGGWAPAIKLSDASAKVLTPGPKRLWRLYDRRGTATGDLLSLPDEAPAPGTDLVLCHHSRPDVSRRLAAADWSTAEEIVVPVLDRGQVVYPGGSTALGDIEAARRRRDDDVDRLDAGVRRLVNPHVYHVSLTPALQRAKFDLVARLTQE